MPMPANVDRPSRVGVLIPSSNTSVEAELGRALPPDITLHSGRMAHKGSVEPNAIANMVQQVEDASRSLASAAMDLIFLCATVPGLLKGFGDDADIVRRIESVTGTRASTTASAMVESLNALGAKRVVLGTPFVQAMNDRIVAFLTASGFEVLAERGLGVADNIEIGRLPPDSAYELGCAIDRKDADAVLLACTNWRTLPVVERLETTLGKPVVSTTQASLRGILQALGRTPSLPGYGRLLA